MAHSNSTTNYNLPQFASTDKPAWLTDINTAYADIDTGMHAAQVAADNAQSDATQALTTAGDAATTAAGADAKGSGAIASLATAFDTTSTYSVGDVVIYNNLLYICSVDVITPGPWTGSANWNRTTMEAIAHEVIKAYDVVYDNTSSGMAATNVQAAIDNLSTVTSGTFTPGENITVLRSSLYKLGNIKFLSIVFRVIDTATAIGTVSTGFEATHNIDFTAMSDSNDTTRFRIQANSNSVEITTTAKFNTYYAFNISYI